MFDDMPRKLTHFNVFLDAGLAFFGRTEEVTPPVLAMKTLDYRSGGMDAPLVIDQGMEPLDCSIKMATYESGVYERYGLTARGPIDILLRGAMTVNGLATPLAIAMRGVITKIDMGSWAGGEDTSMSFDVRCSYLRYDFSERTTVEIDIPNMKRIINGVDQLATQRACILKA